MGHRHRDQLGEPGHDLDRFQGCVLWLTMRGGGGGDGGIGTGRMADKESRTRFGRDEMGQDGRFRTRNSGLLTSLTAKPDKWDLDRVFRSMGQPDRCHESERNFELVKKHCQIKNNHPTACHLPHFILPNLITFLLFLPIHFPRTRLHIP